jgi:hypothetical protein
MSVARYIHSGNHKMPATPNTQKALGQPPMSTPPTTMLEVVRSPDELKQMISP